MLRKAGVFLAGLSLCLVAGCCPIDATTFKMQKRVVESAVQSARDAEKHWDKYTPNQQALWLEANRKAWEGLDRVYNPED